MQGQFALRLFAFDGVFVQSLFENGGDAFVVGGADHQRPFTRLFQTLLVVTSTEIKQSQTGTVTVLWVWPILELLFDHLSSPEQYRGQYHWPSS